MAFNSPLMQLYNLQIDSGVETFNEIITFLDRDLHFLRNDFQTLTPEQQQVQLTNLKIQFIAIRDQIHNLLITLEHAGT